MKHIRRTEGHKVCDYFCGKYLWSTC